MHLKLKFDANTIMTVSSEKILVTRSQSKGKLKILSDHVIIKKIDLETATIIENILVGAMEYNGKVIDLVSKHTPKKQPANSLYCPQCNVPITKENELPSEYICLICEAVIPSSSKNEKCAVCGSEDKKSKLQDEILCSNNHVFFTQELLKKPSVIKEPEEKESEEKEPEDVKETVEIILNVLGYCPTCNSPVVTMEKRPDGDCWCAMDHKFPLKNALKKPKETHLKDSKDKTYVYVCVLCGKKVPEDPTQTHGSYFCTTCSRTNDSFTKKHTITEDPKFCPTCQSLVVSKVINDGTVICSKGHQFDHKLALRRK